MDQATIVSYALGYIAVAIAVFLIFLPALAVFGLLLLGVGAVQVIVLFINVMAVGLYKAALRLFHYLLDRWQRGHRGRLAAH
ncbi:hypothetical protein [Arthrobacter sp. ISL-65]|uniref:hypothetical protein n=1 Tax=Arthrobacter sp. ISL-65 TaxID=2819112 RepID=UPI001BE8966B|nr:hypothetical protein [Arthrobacter sp. ISL-65]MBT2550359.1 hypothetical protein [Arthrobacter sp. ISL-65]